MILSINPGVVLSHLQMVRTEKDDHFRFGKVLLVKRHWFGKKMIAIDVTEEATTNEFPEILEMKAWLNGEYRLIDINNIECISLRKGHFRFHAIEEEKENDG